jgi:pyruvate dehydrogenase E1 component
MVALVGDAELDEGNIYEALQEGWKNDLRNCWWIIDYNRQSLDGIVREGLFEAYREDLRGVRLGRRAVKYGACSAPPSKSRAAKAARVDRPAPTSFTRR